MKLDGRARLVIGVLLAVAFALRITIGVGMPNMVWADEIYQTLEQAHRVAFGEGIIPWEFRDGTRSWIVPGLLAVVMKASSVLGSSPAVYLTACAGLLVLVSLAIVWASARPALSRGDLRGAVLGAVMATVWFELVFFAPKALLEVISGNLFALGVVLVEVHRHDPARVTRRDAIAIAAFLGGSLLLRIQLAPAAAIALGYFWLRVPSSRRTVAITCVVLVAIAGGVDAITWDYPFQSYVENVRINIVEDKSAMFGVAPWHAYFDVFGRLWGAWGLLVIALAALGARRMPLAGCTFAVVLAVHVAIAHKEYRFTYPAIALAVVLAANGASQLVDLVRSRVNTRMATIAALALAALWTTASLVCAVRFHQRHTTLGVSLQPRQWHWSAGRGGLLGMRTLGADPATCGVGLVGLRWYATGGYTYLHRDLLLMELPTPGSLATGGRHVNALLTTPTLPPRVGPYVQGECWEDACIYHRDGGCDPLPTYDFNVQLRMLGE